MKTCIVAGGSAGIENLLLAARELGGECLAVVTGPRAVAEEISRSGVDQVIWAPESADVLTEACAGWVAETVAELAPTVVFGATRASERVLLGAVAARLGAPVFTMVSKIAAADAEVHLTHALFGGIAQQSVATPGPVVVAMEAGASCVAETGVPIVERPMTVMPGITLVETIPASHTRVDLTKAQRIIAVGRGCKTREQLAGISELAELLDAEVACSRPLAEGLDWFTHDRYIGVTGQHVAPELYLALGISGQLQHVVGARGAASVVVVNTDANAPYFAECDFGVVGDLAELVPALVQTLRSS